MDIRFDAKTVVVSGAGHGFGRAIAESFAGLGARVFGCDLSAAELAETAKAGVSTQVLDLTDRAASADWIKRVEDTVGARARRAGQQRRRRRRADNRSRSRTSPMPTGTASSRSMSAPPSC